jgi:hypothetical protein
LLHKNNIAINNIIHKNRQKGVYLFECIIAIALIACIATISFQFVRVHSTAMLAAEIEKLYAVMTFLQRKAHAEKCDQILYCDTKTNTYRFDNTNIALGPSIIFGTDNGICGPPYKPEKIITDPITFKNHMIFFYADGTISSGTIYITDTQKSGVYALSSAVSQVSYMRKYKYQNGWHLDGNFSR